MTQRAGNLQSNVTYLQSRYVDFLSEISSYSPPLQVQKEFPSLCLWVPFFLSWISFSLLHCSSSTPELAMNSKIPWFKNPKHDSYGCGGSLVSSPASWFLVTPSANTSKQLPSLYLLPKEQKRTVIHKMFLSPDPTPKTFSSFSQNSFEGT